MPAFYLLLLIVLILIWLAAGRWFRPLGELICRLFGGAADSMKEDTDGARQENDDEASGSPP